jgi:hypothetical protein
MATSNSPENNNIAGKERAITTIAELVARLKADGTVVSPELLEKLQRREPTKEGAIELFNAVENKFPRTLGDTWYLVVLSALVGVDPDYAGNLYTFLINKPEYKTSESRKSLVRRLREVLVKNVSVQGVCRPLEALFAIAALERPEDQDFSFSREHWRAGPQNRERGEKWLNTSKILKSRNRFHSIPSIPLSNR